MCKRKMKNRRVAFYAPDESNPWDDLKEKFTEACTRLGHEFAQFDFSIFVLKKMIKACADELNPTEAREALKLLDHLKLLQKVGNRYPEQVVLQGLYYESHTNDRFVTDTDCRVYYLDHPNFSQAYPNFNTLLQNGQILPK